MPQDKANKWDQKAKNYNRYNPEDSRFEAKILEEINAQGISFEGKSILDVGAGTGVYTIRVAQKAKDVEAIDFSSSMLEVLMQDAKKIGLQNIHVQVSTWSEFEDTKKYDIALCTMSPALQSPSDFEKYHKIAKTKIYLGWAGKRDSDILNALFKAHHQTYTAPNGSQSLKNWLSNQKYFFTCKDIEELKVSTCKEVDGLEKYRWHLEIREVLPDDTIIKEVLKEFTKDGIITETTTNHMNLIVW